MPGASPRNDTGAGPQDRRRFFISQTPAPRDSDPIRAAPTAILPCARCGYDLRAHPRDAVCPECALPVTATLAAAAGPLGGARRSVHAAAAILLAAAGCEFAWFTYLVIARAAPPRQSVFDLVASAAFFLTPWSGSLAGDGILYVARVNRADSPAAAVMLLGALAVATATVVASFLLTPAALRRRAGRSARAAAHLARWLPPLTVAGLCLVRLAWVHGTYSVFGSPSALRFFYYRGAYLANNAVLVAWALWAAHLLRATSHRRPAAAALTAAAAATGETLLFYFAANRPYPIRSALHVLAWLALAVATFRLWRATRPAAENEGTPANRGSL